MLRAGDGKGQKVASDQGAGSELMEDSWREKKMQKK